MSKDTIKVNMNIYDIPIVVEQLKRLEQENKQLKEKLDIILEDNNQLEEIRIKAIEYIKEHTLIDYYGMPCFNNTNNIDELLEILGDKENENNNI